MLIPVALITFSASLIAISMRSLQREIPDLIQEVKAILDSSATFALPAAIPATNDGRGG